MSTFGDQPYNLDNSADQDVILIKSWEFTENTALGDYVSIKFSSTNTQSLPMSSALNIVALNPVNISIKSTSFVGNNTFKNGNGVLYIYSENIDE